jgi:hypothetical protein
MWRQNVDGRRDVVHRIARSGVLEKQLVVETTLTIDAARRLRAFVGQDVRIRTLTEC